MNLEEFLLQYKDGNIELEECREKLLELEYPERGNRILKGEHTGMSNHPEQYTILKSQLEKKIAYLERNQKKVKHRIEAFLSRLNPRVAKLLRRKYIEDLNTLQLAAWMHVKPASANAAVKKALTEAEKEYNKNYKE